MSLRQSPPGRKNSLLKSRGGISGRRSQCTPAPQQQQQQQQNSEQQQVNTQDNARNNPAFQPRAGTTHCCPNYSITYLLKSGSVDPVPLSAVHAPPTTRSQAARRRVLRPTQADLNGSSRHTTDPDRRTVVAGSRLIPYKTSSPVGRHAVPTLSLSH